MGQESIRKRLDAHGMKFTPQRYSLMAFLMENRAHPTASEIFDGVNRLDPRSSRGTVYRNLKELVEAGLVREVAVEGRSARFDVTGVPHHHFICDRCGEVANIEWFALPLPPAAVAGDRVVREYELIVRGLCPGCVSAPPRHHIKAVETDTVALRPIHNRASSWDAVESVSIPPHTT